MKLCAASVVECRVKLKLKLSEVVEVEVGVCPRIEIDLAVALFNLET